MKKLTALVAGGLGYVLGARAGRQRYEQIRGMAQKVKNNPKVQETAQKAAETAKGAAPVLKDKVTGSSGGSGGSGGSASGPTTPTSTTTMTDPTPMPATPSTSPTSGIPLEDTGYPPA